MANTTRRLTHLQVEKAKAKPKEYNLFDGGGLHLRIHLSGSKTWLLNYTRPGTSKRTNMKLGEYPDLKLTAARRFRDDYRKQLAIGNDPQIYKAEQARNKTQENENRFKSVAKQWLKIEVKKGSLTEDCAEDLYNSLANHVFPKIGKKLVYKITGIEMLAVLAPLEEAGKLDTQKGIIQQLNMIMEYAECKEY